MKVLQKKQLKPKKANVSILKAAEGIELIDSTYSDEHEHEGEETHSDELEHESEEGANEDHVHEDDGHDHGDFDPYVWLEPVLAIDSANNIKNSLSDIMQNMLQSLNLIFFK